MNLLLYVEARQILARRQGKSILDNDCLPALPDSIFEELGYYGALDTDETSETDLGEDVGELFRWLNGSALSSPALTDHLYRPSGFHSHDMA